MARAPSAAAGGVGHPAPARDRLNAPLLLFGLLAAPAAAALEAMIGTTVSGRACFPTDHPLTSPRFDLQPIVWIVHLTALAVAVAAVLASVVAWRRTRHERAGGHETMIEVGEGRTRFLAIWALLISLGFLALIVFDTPGLIVLQPC